MVVALGSRPRVIRKVPSLTAPPSQKPELARIAEARRAWKVAMISAGSMPCMYTDAMPRSCVAELALDVQRYALACHFDRQVEGNHHQQRQ